jgi:hypothetical protein
VAAGLIGWMAVMSGRWGMREYVGSFILSNFQRVLVHSSKMGQAAVDETESMDISHQVK